MFIGNIKTYLLLYPFKEKYDELKSSKIKYYYLERYLQ